MTDTEKRPFNPADHLIRIGNADYLEVKWRIAWLRDEWPMARINTELIEHVLPTINDAGRAVFKTEVELYGENDLCMGSATGWGQEDSVGFGDYLEKAETKSLGRALAALGYGTQFCADHDFGGGEGRVVDGPINNRGGGRPNLQPVRDGEGGSYSGPPPSNSKPASAPQMGAIAAASKRAGMDDPDTFHAACEQVVGVEDIGTGAAPLITSAQASTLISYFNDRINKR